MYEIFNSYLDVETWYTSHPLDQQRFLRALAQVVRDPDFNPDEMGQYMRERKGVDRDDARGYSQTIDQRMTEAWAIKDFLELGA